MRALGIRSRWQQVGSGAIALGFVFVLILVAALLRGPLRMFASGLAVWLTQHGSLGVLVYSAVYVVSTIAMIPASLLTAAAGFAYGIGRGILIAYPVSLAGSMLAFLLGRNLFRSWTQRKLAFFPLVTSLDHALAKNGVRVIVLLRLSGIMPFNILNYVLGASRIPFRDYLLGSIVGALPSTLLYVYLGSIATNAIDLPRGAPAIRIVTTVTGIVFSVAAFVLLTRYAKREMARQWLTNGVETRGREEAQTDARANNS